jgi:hypothetical protein
MGRVPTFAVSLLLVTRAAAGAPVDFSRQIAPLLERACAECHAGAHARGGLRLDELADVVVPRDSARSVLMQRLLGLGGEPRMPRGRPPLDAAELALVRRWIDEGAAGLAGRPRLPVDHWAYHPPVRPRVPAVKRIDWPRTPIDAFVLQRLEAEGLAPAPPADREALLTRVSLDLTGLPPTLPEIDAFLADTRPDAYERVVDRLLASPHFGERWAVPWLDAARYADSNGYERDGRRSMWRYRDWVVAALNADLPYDRFTVEQLAGDLLPGATPAQRIATGFHRNTAFNEEAGVDPEEARWERLVDRVSTTATVWLGTTLGCAQCHDHKFDPFTRRDFYGLMAFFESADEVTLPMPTPEQAAALARIEAELKAIEPVLTTWTPALGTEQRRWEAAFRALPARFTSLPPRASSSTAGTALAPAADASVLVGAAKGADVQTFMLETALDRITALRLEALPDPRLPGGGPGRGAGGNFWLTSVELEVAPAGRDAWEPVAWRAAFSDDRPRDEPERYAVETLLPGTPRAPNLDPDSPRGWGVAALYDGARRLPRQAVLVPERPFGFSGGTRLRVRLRYDDPAGETIGRLRLSVTDREEPETITAVSAALAAVIALPEARRSQLERDQLAEAYRAVAPSLAPLRARRAALESERSALQVDSTLALAAGAPRPTFVREGGAYTRKGEVVPASVPAALAPAAPPRDRLALARWLASAENPLAARVVVNRLWAQYFGRGLVETVEDFGSQGAVPSHPTLLDWLATELVRQGWRQKAIHRLIVTSAVYRQSSIATASRRRDPDDRLYGRFPRLRLDAELVRDRALVASGLLDPRLGGPPVFPAQPAGVFAPPNSTEPPWPAGLDPHRRSLYTFWRRTAPYPTVALFDAPSREVCSVRRARTNTPLQALVTLNDPVFWEAARALGQRMAEEGPDLSRRLLAGFRRSTGRRPTPDEEAVLERLYRKQRARGSSDATALAVVANALLNLDETLTRN